MKITTGEVRQIAQLARLELADAEMESIASELESILEHIRELEELDTAGMIGMSGASQHSAPFREDVPGADTLAQPLSEIAPTFEQGFFTVPRLEALDADALAESEGGA